MSANVSQAGYDFVVSVITDSQAVVDNIDAQITALELNKTELLGKITDAESVLADLIVV